MVGKKTQATLGGNLTKSKIAETTANKNDNFRIVALGASAGGLEALELFFTKVPSHSGMAYIVITHLDRDHESIMTELIKKYTAVPVFTIVDGTRVKPDTIYVIPPRKNVSLKNGILHLLEQSEPHYGNLPINYFFRSLALDREQNSIAIILSGAGTDGSLGARDIKLNGGIVIAQDPQSAKFNSMPISAINTGYVDFILSPDKMPDYLIKRSNEEKIRETVPAAELSQIFSILRSKTSYDFSSYKLTTVYRRIEKQMLIHNLFVLADYVTLLRKNPEAVDSLFKDLLIGVTRFFRDPESFNAFKKMISAKILENKPYEYNLRVWVPGCSSGEEVYSIAIIIAECMEAANKHFNVQIFGTDIDNNALMVARSATYTNEIEHDIGEERLKKFFTKEKNRYKIKSEIRSMVIFGEQNIIKDPPFTKVDIISCRNLLIYLNVAMQKKLIPMFHYSLKPGGILFLGSSESISNNANLFAACDKKAKLFESIDSSKSKRALLNFPNQSQVDPETTLIIKEKFTVSENSEMDLAIKKLLLDQYLTPCAVINTKGDILYFYGAVDKYINSIPLKDNLNIVDVVNNDIKRIIQSALTNAVMNNTEITYHRIAVNINEHSCTIGLRIIPIKTIKILQSILLIFFEEELAEAKIYDYQNEENNSKKTNQHVHMLERELTYTKENLQATIEELESSNEELQSLNEELQSTNEEIETSKEELHSLNEELVITNTELQNRIDQLATVHDDMNNLFNSTDIATFFLDNNLCIKRFTPKAQEFIHLIPSDIGRSISHFATTIKYDKLMDDARDVLKTLKQKSIEVQNKNDSWFLIRILPYRTISNMIDGVVITLTDITEHKEAEKKLQKLNNALTNSLALSKNVIDTVMIPLLVLSIELKIISANRSFYKAFHLLPEDVIGKHLYNIKGWDSPELRKLLESDFPPDAAFEGFEIETPFNGSKLIFNARKISAFLENDDIILLSIGVKNES